MKQLRILVFSAGFGNGHFRAAEAVVEGIQLKEPDAEIIHLDFGEFLNKRLNTVAKRLYMEMIKHTPRLWGTFYYKTAKLQPKSIMQRFLNQLGRSDFLKYIQGFEPDLIVCTYPTVSSVLAQLRQERILHVPVITVITDYAVHSHWVHPGVDRYMVACKEVKDSLVSWGIEGQRVRVTGIPVSPKFERKIDRGQIISKFGLNPDLPTFLVMGGVYEGEIVKRICKQLTDSQVPIQSLVVCGKNEKLYQSLEDLSAQARNLIVRFRYIDNVEELMEVSDLIVTKAGGLTVTEALTKHLPLVIFKPIPGQEVENAQFVKRQGAGLVAGSEEELEKLLDCFSNYPKGREQLKKKAAAVLPGRSAERAVEALLQLVPELRIEQKIG
ncbi:MGDG synthase family glycosyltransferase [Desulfosporosinus youngiae]|uniref:UDP-N-acetylglucosamine:LPS N-acetylglucosamine transferase n=1 Tax=Desulfosporosinus youngiae DSM 17734 TaxID=768710 RepID=H5Y4F2_9FIRM|nr:glycosyltransferase [Desulfosporosinus youngiae]EHQ89980.1 UDP-N-acetylglucosamine:LPS N-acetylglucosamine transferase [Desulfosporosinus youngiae DSM 17734]